MRKSGVSLEQILASPTIRCISRRFSDAYRLVMDTTRDDWCSNVSTIHAPEVFQALNLNLESLSHIFPQHDEMLASRSILGRLEEAGNLPSFDQRPKKTVASSYETLGCCPIEDIEGWRQLAVLMGKEIEVHYMDSQFCVGLQGKYQPDGTFEVNEEFRSWLPRYFAVPLQQLLET